MAADLSKSAQHLLEALVLGARTPSDAANPLVSQKVAATIPTAAASAWTSVNVTVTGVKVGDIAFVSAPDVALLHMILVTAQVTATDTVTLFGLADATGFTGAAKNYNIIVFRQS